MGFLKSVAGFALPVAGIAGITALVAKRLMGKSREGSLKKLSGTIKGVDPSAQGTEAPAPAGAAGAAADAAASVVLLRDRFSASFLSLKSWYVLCIDTPGRAKASRRLAYAYPINRCNRHVSIAFAAWHAHPQSPDRPPDRQTHTVLQSWRFWYTATQMRWSEKRDWSSSSKVTGWFQATSCCTLSPRATSD